MKGSAWLGASIAAPFVLFALALETPAVALAQGAPEWFSHPPVQEGYLTEVASGDSNLNALVDALIRLARQPEVAKSKRDKAAKQIVATSIGPIRIQTTSEVYAGDDKAEPSETVDAQIELKTRRGKINIKAHTEIRRADRSGTDPPQSTTLFTAELVNSSVRDIVDTLRHEGLTVLTASADDRYYVLLKYRIR